MSKHYEDYGDEDDDERYNNNYDPNYYERMEKQEKLIESLHKKRIEFAGIGTNKAKRRLNKLAKDNVIAKSVRIALEIEDKNITAKDTYGKYREKVYNTKQKLIDDLCILFKDNNWVYGLQNSDVVGVSHVIYFEIPECEQISWHLTIMDAKKYPVYDKEWDKKENSTLDKLEVISKTLLIET